jgi:hypothetical protein
MSSYQSGMTLAQLRRSVERDSYSDFLPLAAWVEEEQVRRDRVPENAPFDHFDQVEWRTQ